MVLCQFIRIPAIGQLVRAIQAFAVDAVDSAFVTSRISHERKLVGWLGQKDVRSWKEEPSLHVRGN